MSIIMMIIIIKNYCNSNNNSNLFSVVCLQNLVLNEETRAIFKQKTQQTFKTLIEETAPARRLIQISNFGAIKNEALSLANWKKSIA